MSAHPRPDLTVALCGVQLPNPLILASGILGTEAELLARVVVVALIGRERGNRQQGRKQKGRGGRCFRG